jgi:hypothetical protein
VLIQAHVLDGLRSLPDGCVHCCVTSPPYYGLRDYGLPPSRWGDGWEGCLGLEPTPAQFVVHLVEVFAEVLRVLRDDGTLWLNLGDSYASRPNGDLGPCGLQGSLVPHAEVRRARAWRRHQTTGPPPGLKHKDLMGLPWRLAFALQEAGWWLRADVIWSKPNPMPESVKDRPAKSHEYLFLLSKRARYYYDAEAVREPDKGSDHPRHVLRRPEPSGGMLPEHRGIRQAAGRAGHGRSLRTRLDHSDGAFPGGPLRHLPAGAGRPVHQGGDQRARGVSGVRGAVGAGGGVTGR